MNGVIGMVGETVERIPRLVNAHGRDCGAQKGTFSSGVCASVGVGRLAARLDWVAASTRPYRFSYSSRIQSWTGSFERCVGAGLFFISVFGDMPRALAMRTSSMFSRHTFLALAQWESYSGGLVMVQGIYSVLFVAAAMQQGFPVPQRSQIGVIGFCSQAAHRLLAAGETFPVRQGPGVDPRASGCGLAQRRHLHPHPKLRRYGINPQEYLTVLLGRLPSMTTGQVRDLLAFAATRRRGGGRLTQH
jgi:hypothetical protein